MRNRIFDPELFSEVWVTVTQNKRRSLLTAFGVFWGVFMLVVMLSVGKGIQGGIFAGIDMIPQNMCICWSQNTSIPYAGFRKGRWWHIKADDIEALRTQIPELQRVSPMVHGRSVNVVCGEKSGSYSIGGVAGDYTEIMPLKINEGRYINDLDVQQRRKVVVLGQKIVDEVFRGKSPVGTYVSVGGISYQCIGIAESKSQSVNMGGREEEMVRMPYTLVQQLYNMGDEVGMLMIIGKKDKPVAMLEDRMREVICSRHSISPDDTQALEFMNLEKMLKVFKALGMGIDLLIWIVGLGTLLSGAIGVSNIVMITVKERTTEIGVRRAIGAQPADIIRQIMTESLVITVAAGITGLVAGVVTMYFVGQIDGLGFGDNSIKLVDPMLNFSTAVAALAVIMATGLLAGLMPAARALKIKAIDAIREE